MIDVNVLMSVQLLVETTASVNQTLLNLFYQYLLFDFRIWSNSEFPVRIGEYLGVIIENKASAAKYKKKIEIENTYLRMFCATLFWLFSINCIHFDNLEKCCMIDFMIALSCWLTE